ncbi:TetR/AcrR family transcriptional regulator [Streptomyces sp. AK02-01A]|uniref:TetR/AcrR family transcriptional regulator n=1 Tax=Streptomyces sp. AK02-01A TaxID=3028648 RepID=UPI0029B78CF5|nr:TetR/AcrR family transcriptional regulator [Streptomyces sp. AK02-01A]MDX3855452.1 TetR/AcrR family transcriptional regulator [Streptomyces sp. AK02-01A]
MKRSQQPGASLRSQERRAELIATGRKLFANTSYDALSMDDIARHAGVAKGLIYYYFRNKRGYYLAIVEDSVAELVTLAASDPELPRTERVLRTVEAYLYFAQHNEAAYRTIITGGVGFDTQVQAIRDAVRTGLVSTVAEGAYGRRDIPPIARLALLGWLSSVEWLTLEWLGHQELTLEIPRDLLVRMLRHTLNTIEEFAPECPAPPPDPHWRPFTGRADAGNPVADSPDI